MLKYLCCRTVFPRQKCFLCMLSQSILCFIYSHDLRLFLFLYAHMLMIHNCVTNVLTISPPDAALRLQQPQPDWRWQNLPVLQSSLLPCPLLNKSAARVELLMFCIHLLFIQSYHIFLEYFLFWCVFTIPPRLFLKLSAWAKFSQLLLQTYYQFSSPICSILPLPSFSQKLRKTIFFKHWLYNKIILSQLYTIKGQFSFLLEAIWF